MIETAHITQKKHWYYKLMVMEFNNRQLQNLIREVGIKPARSINDNRHIIINNSDKFDTFIDIKTKG